MGHTASSRRIGEVLVEEGLLSEAAVHRALGFQRASGEKLRLGTILLTWDLVDEDALLVALAKLHGCVPARWEILSSAPIDTVLLLSAAQAVRLGAVPYAAQRALVRIAFADPSNIAAVDEAAALTGRRVVPAVSPEIRLLQAHRKFYGRPIPLEYRGVLQKLDRRTTRGKTAARVLPESGPAALERPADTPKAPAPPPAGDSERDARRIPISPGSSPAAPLAASSDAAPRSRRADPPSGGWKHGPDAPVVPTPPGSDDSLSEWVGEALAAFTDASSEPAIVPLDVDDSFEKEAPPREDSAATARPGAEASLPTEEHRRGVPDSIPPFRRAGDPTLPFASPPASSPVPLSPFDREEEVIAGMWRPAPEAPPSGDPDWDLDVEASGRDAKTRDEIADSVLHGSLAALPRVILLGTGRTAVVGWRGRGPGLTPESVAAIRVPHAEMSVFSSVKESGVPHFAVSERSDWPRAFGELLGAKPLDCAIFPIRVLDSVAAFLYADRLGEQMRYEDFALIARAAASAAAVLSRFLLQTNPSASHSDR